MNPFLDLLLSRGFSQGASGRWFSPDSKYGDGVVVSLRNDGTAVACWKGGRTLYDVKVKKDVDKFFQEVR